MSRHAWTGPLALAAATALTIATVAFAQEEPAGEASTVDARAAEGRHYFDLRRATPVGGDAARGKTRTELCSACHGENGLSIVPIYPDIAGQSADYMYWQMVKFKDAGFGGTVMAVALEELNDQDMRDLAQYYASLPYAGPPAEPGAEPADAEEPRDPELLARGEQLYLHGNPAAGIPPCQACHGADARGHPKARHVDGAGFMPYAAYPALRGQRDAYLVTRIAEYQGGKHTSLSTDFVMGGAAAHLDQASVEALAAWLSSLPR